MPGFVGHTIGNTVVLVGTTAVMASQGWSLADIAVVDAGIVIANFVLSPDLDLFNSKSMEDWGWMRIFWWPYAKMVKHRDLMHVPGIGTLVRWLYMAVVLSIVIVPIAIILRRMNFSMTFQGDAEDILWYLGYVADLLVGAALADTMHYVLDVTTTRLKRLMPRRYRDRYERYAQRHREHEGFYHPSYRNGYAQRSVREEKPTLQGDHE
jgi:uncharacterized metal-binding protein